MDANGSWLCPSERDRERLLDMSARVQRARQIGAGTVTVALVSAIPWLGWLPLIPVLAMTVNLLTTEPRLRRSARPEFVYAQSVLFTQCVVGAGVALTGGPTSPVMMLMAAATVTGAIRFPPRAVVLFFGTGMAILIAACMVDPAALIHDPAMLIVTVSLLVAVTAPVMALLDAELHHRAEAVIDPLTGLLNRKALVSRFAELEQQARQSEASVCVIAADLDTFKNVNDSHGHARGDDVLRDVTYEMRKRLRTFELMYRLGGDELVVVLPGVDLPEGVAVAERLRAAVAECQPAGLQVTVSMGVAAACGSEVSCDALVAAADRALYAAKGAGRNVVRADGHEDIAPMLEAVGVVIA
jgi:diguanylate cyclase (GGDEF)-like protein